MIAALALAAALAVGGSAKGCGEQPCRIQVWVGSEQPVSAQAFLGVVPVDAAGQPAGIVGGYFDGRSWRTGTPVAFWRGQLAGARRATIPLEGGICAKARAEGLASPRLGIFVGLGVVDQSVGDAPLDDVPAALRAELDAAQAELARMAAGPEAAFVEMRQAGRTRLLQTIDCTGGK